MTKDYDEFSDAFLQAATTYLELRAALKRAAPPQLEHVKKQVTAALRTLIQRSGELHAHRAKQHGLSPKEYDEWLERSESESDITPYSDILSDCFWDMFSAIDDDGNPFFSASALEDDSCTDYTLTLDDAAKLLKSDDWSAFHSPLPESAKTELREALVKWISRTASQFTESPQGEQ